MSTFNKPLADYLRRLGASIRALRQKRGMTQEDLGERSGINPKYVGYIERGERNVTLRNLLAVAGALGVEPNALLPAQGIVGEITEEAKAIARVGEIDGAWRGEHLPLSRKELIDATSTILARKSASTVKAFYEIARSLK